MSDTPNTPTPAEEALAKLNEAEALAAPEAAPADPIGPGERAAIDDAIASDPVLTANEAREQAGLEPVPAPAEAAPEPARPAPRAEAMEPARPGLRPATAAGQAEAEGREVRTPVGHAMRVAANTERLLQKLLREHDEGGVSNETWAEVRLLAEEASWRPGKGRRPMAGVVIRRG